ncbi:hypothetical protein Ancab_035637 [Ancistrocladus abbreviatus]
MAVRTTDQPLLEQLRDEEPSGSEPKEWTAELEKSLRRLESFLRFFGFCPNSAVSTCVSWFFFLLLGVAAPFIIIEFCVCPEHISCEKYEIKGFELEISVFQVIAAAISLICIFHNFRKYGVRKFLFVDRYHGSMLQFRDEYIKKINNFFHLLAFWILPCFLLKAAREIVRVICVHQDPLWESVALVILLVSWVYSTTIYLAGTLLFNLVCNLQVIHFDNYGNLLQRDLDVSVYIEEHMRLTYYLSKISHRFRLFLILEFLVITASQIAAVLETTASRRINFINGADFVVSSIVQVVGIIICLHSATKITHRAQALVSVASRWHALVTSNSTESIGTSANGRNLEGAGVSVPIIMNYSASDLESTDDIPVTTNVQLASYVSSYHKRQAFVTYMHSNTGGITIFGWIIDRALINTIFFIELSLVSFVLGKTISFSTG